MAITYIIGEYTSADSSVEVTYTDDNGFEHKRHVNIPKNSDGTIDEEHFADILEGQLRGVENKLRVGAVTFTDPNAVVEETTTEGVTDPVGPSDPADPADVM